jgi:hypothetical protein
MRNVRVTTAVLVFLTSVVNASAFDIEGLDLRLGYAYTVNEYEGQGSEGVPLDTYVGLALPARFSGLPVGVGLTVDVLYREYLVTSDGPVVPTQIETGSDAGVGVGGVLGLIMGTPVTLSLRPIDSLSISVGGSPTVVLRIPVRTIEGDTTAMRQYFADRILFPETMLSVVYDYSDSWSFGFTGRWLLPVFNNRLETELPVRDQMMIAGHLIIRRQFD